MADFDLNSLSILDALSIGSNIRSEIKKGEFGSKWVRRYPSLAWVVAAIVDLVVWPVALIVTFSFLISTLGLLVSIFAWLVR